MMKSKTQQQQLKAALSASSAATTIRTKNNKNVTFNNAYIAYSNGETATAASNTTAEVNVSSSSNSNSRDIDTIRNGCADSSSLLEQLPNTVSVSFEGILSYQLLELLKDKV